MYLGTVAFVAPLQVLADGVDARLADFLTFVRVSAQSFVRAESVAGLTLTRVTADGVDTAPVLTQTAAAAAALVDIEAVA